MAAVLGAGAGGEDLGPEGGRECVWTGASLGVWGWQEDSMGQGVGEMQIGQGIVEQTAGRNLGAEGLGAEDLGAGQGGGYVWMGQVWGQGGAGGRFRGRGEI